MNAQTLAAAKMAQIIESESNLRQEQSPEPHARRSRHADFRRTTGEICRRQRPAFSGIQNNHWAESPDSREALVLAYNKQPEEDGKLVSVVSWILPITKKRVNPTASKIKLPLNTGLTPNGTAKNSTPPCVNILWTLLKSGAI